MIPKFEEFLYPFLVALKDGQKTSNEMRQIMISHFNLTPDDCAMKTRGGKTLQLNDRIGWVRQYYRRALFIEMPQRGIYKMTQRGLDYLATHTSLTKEDLMQYPEFAAYANGAKITEATATPNNPQADELTPTEILANAYDSLKETLVEELLSAILEQSPTFFEHLVLKLLENMGYGKGVVTQRTNDEGIDGIIDEDKLGLDKIHFQAKRYKPGTNIGRPLIQNFVGALDGAGVNKGVFITTSSFSKTALEYKSSKKIAMIDGKQLAQLMIQYNVGVTTEYIYEIKKIDKDFFEEE